MLFLDLRINISSYYNKGIISMFDTRKKMPIKNLEEDSYSDPLKTRDEFKKQMEELVDTSAIQECEKAMMQIMTNARSLGFDLDDIKEYFAMKTQDNIDKLPRGRSAYSSLEEDKEMNQLAESTNYFLSN